MSSFARSPELSTIDDGKGTLIAEMTLNINQGHRRWQNSTGTYHFLHCVRIKSGEHSLTRNV